jgi:hypothetical protein
VAERLGIAAFTLAPPWLVALGATAIALVV